MKNLTLKLALASILVLPAAALADEKADNIAKQSALVAQYEAIVDSYRPYIKSLIGENADKTLALRQEIAKYIEDQVARARKSKEASVQEALKTNPKLATQYPRLLERAVNRAAQKREKELNAQYASLLKKLDVIGSEGSRKIEDDYMKLLGQMRNSRELLKSAQHLIADQPSLGEVAVQNARAASEWMRMATFNAKTIREAATQQVNGTTFQVDKLRDDFKRMADIPSKTEEEKAKKTPTKRRYQQEEDEEEAPQGQPAEQSVPSDNGWAN